MTVNSMLLCRQLSFSHSKVCNSGNKTPPSLLLSQRFIHSIRTMGYKEQVEAANWWKPVNQAITPPKHVGIDVNHWMWRIRCGDCVSLCVCLCVVRSHVSLAESCRFLSSDEDGRSSAFNWQLLKSWSTWIEEHFQVENRLKSANMLIGNKIAI